MEWFYFCSGRMICVCINQMNWELLSDQFKSKSRIAVWIRMRQWSSNWSESTFHGSEASSYWLPRPSLIVWKPGQICSNSAASAPELLQHSPVLLITVVCARVETTFTLFRCVWTQTSWITSPLIGWISASRFLIGSHCSQLCLFIIFQAQVKV